LSSVEDVDVAAALTKAAGLQTQLQASYQIIAGSRQLTLASFLS
jgi:flagellin-like hook-associated protein FlgL